MTRGTEHPQSADVIAGDELAIERRDGVTVVRLNRPRARNALTDAMLRGIGAAVLEAESGGGARVLVLTGAGDRSFCSGMDLRAFAAGAQIGYGTDPQTLAYHRLVAGEVTVPVVAAVNGSAIGGGLELVLGCDLVVAAETVTFALPETRLGLFPAAGGTAIGRRIPLSVALEMTLTGDSITAERAHRLGLVNAVTAPGGELPAALALAERIAANGPLGVAACKELVRLSVLDPARASERQEHWRSVVFASADAKEGAAAFVEKRTPVWRNR